MTKTSSQKLKSHQLGELNSILDNLERELKKKKSIKNDIWLEDPVDFITFCRDWVREPIFDGPQTDVAHKIFNITNPKEWTSEFNEILLLWGKGSGKGSVSAKIIVYAAYLLKCMVNPRKFFKIGTSAPIHLINVSYNSKQAKEVFLQGYLKPTVLRCVRPETGKNFFAEKGMDLRDDYGWILSDKIYFEKPNSDTGEDGGISAESVASDSHSGEGYSPLICFVDELSVMKPAEKANSLLDTLISSGTSRFEEYFKIIIASYKHGRACLMSMRVNEAIDKNKPRSYVSQASTWDVNKNKKKESFAEEYANNPDGSRRRYECLDTEGVDEQTFIKQLDRLDRCIIPNRNPFEGNVIWAKSDQLHQLVFKDWFKPVYTANYYVHIDLAKGGKKNDKVGLSMVHKEGLETLTREELDDFIKGQVTKKNFKIKADIILQIRAGASGEVIFEDIRQFIFRLNAMGFKIHTSLDGFQSMDFIQQMKDKGFNSKLLSLDRNRKGYDSLLSVIYRDAIELYEHKILYRELTELEESDDGKSVDHPFQSAIRAKDEDEEYDNRGSKDVADSICGAVFESLFAPAMVVPLQPTMITPTHASDNVADDLNNFEQQISGKLINVTNPKTNKIDVQKVKRRDMPFV